MDIGTRPAGTDSHLRPYELGDDGPVFREALASLADEFLAEAERRCGDLLDAHMARLASGGEDVPRTRMEHALELLTLGVLRQELGWLAAGTSEETVRELAQLWRTRSTDPASKASADVRRAGLFRGILDRSVPGRTCTDSAFVRWLASTGEFVQESLRLDLWLQSCGVFFPSEELVDCTTALAAWFVPLARLRLGRWTRGVEEFRQAILQGEESREDLLLVTRSEPLYHLNMVGAEVMNRAFRSGYEARPDKIVLVPGCMRSRPDSECRARREGLDISCTRCHPGCEVAGLDRLGEEHGFRVFVVPHASSFTAWLEHWRGRPGTSLLAVACPLHLLPGGYEMRALDHQAQCLMLRYSGCSRHWDPAGTPTRIDRGQLLELVGAA